MLFAPVLPSLTLTRNFLGRRIRERRVDHSIPALKRSQRMSSASEIAAQTEKHEKLVEKQFDLNDPNQVEWTRSRHFEEMYCNRTEMGLSQFDFRMRFMQVLGMAAGHGNKMLIEERGAVTISHEHLKRFLPTLVGVMRRNAEMLELEPGYFESMLLGSPALASPDTADQP